MNNHDNFSFSSFFLSHNLRPFVLHERFTAAASQTNQNNYNKRRNIRLLYFLKEDDIFEESFNLSKAIEKSNCEF